MSLVLQSTGGGSVTLQEAVTASNLTITVPAVTGTMAIDGPAFSAYSNANQNISNNTYTLITNNTEFFDTASAFNSTGSTVGTAPAYSFNPQVAGYYQIIASIRDNTGGAANSQWVSLIYKNGSAYSATVSNTPSTGVVGIVSTCSNIIYMNGTTDYLQQYVYQNNGSTLATNSNATYSFFSGAMIRSA
jgi:hypothetical protein